MCWGSYGGDSEKAINTVPTNTRDRRGGGAPVFIPQELAQQHAILDDRVPWQAAGNLVEYPIQEPQAA